MKNKNLILILGFLAIFSLCIITMNVEKNFFEEQTSLTSATITEKIEWGIKRSDNHEQPDLGTKNKKLIEEYEGIAMGNKEQKYVYLTFDEGYEAGYTSKILDVLRENNVKATFFITAHYFNTADELIKRMIDEGHITVNHKSMPSLNDEQLKEEIMKLHTSVYDKYGYEMQYLRPPKGEYNARTLQVSKNLGYKTVMWSLAYDDWDEQKQNREEYGKKKILENVHNGAVILLHPNSKDNANILDYCIKEIKNMGYEFRSLNNFEK